MKAFNNDSLKDFLRQWIRAILHENLNPLSGGNLLRARNWDIKSPYDDGEKNLTNLHI